MFVVEITVEVSYLVLSEIKVLLLGVFHAEPVVQIADPHILIDQTDNLHVVLPPVSVHKFNLNLYYLSRVLPNLCVLKFCNKSFHDQLQTIIISTIAKLTAALYCTR